MRLAGAPGEAFADIRRKAVHLVGLASVEALGERMGAPLDPRRFRANVVLEGTPPFAELDWIGREVRVGSAALRAFDRTARRANVEGNPGTAERDGQPQHRLRELDGHADFGVYAEVVGAGAVGAGDPVALSPA